MDQKEIRCTSQIWNFDDMGLIPDISKGQDIVVPLNINVIHAPNPMNRQSITMIGAVCADEEHPLPGIIILGKYIMQHWFHENLRGKEYITVSDTEYTTNS